MVPPLCPANASPQLGWHNNRIFLGNVRNCTDLPITERDKMQPRPVELVGTSSAQYGVLCE